jgi:hypothetical protein
MKSFETSLRDTLSPPRGEPSPLRDALSSRGEPSPLRDALSSRGEPSPLRDALSSRGEPSPLRDALSSRGEPSPLRDSLSPREPSSLRDALSPSPPRETASLRDALSASLRDALSSRDITPPRETLTSRDPAPSRNTSLRDTLSPRDALSSRDAASNRDTLLSRNAASERDGRFGRELVRDTGLRTPLDEAADMGLTPSRESISHWDAPPAPPGADTSWKRSSKKRSDAFEGDTALRELRSRLAAVPEDQAPEPPLAPPKAPIFASVVRLAGVMVLAAAGALGFLWITSPHGSQTANQETTLVSLRGFEPTTRSASAAKPPPAVPDIAADQAPPEPAPVAEKPWAVANYTSDPTEKTMAPSGLSPRMAGPPRGPVVNNRVVTAPPVQPVPAAVAPAPPPAPVVVTAPPPAAPAAVSPSDRDEIAALLVRARTYLAAGDVAAARLVLRRAAEREDPQAALALGGTYDPAVLKRLGIISFHADPAQARDWYRKAEALGSADAALRLEQLVQQTGR